MTNEITEEYVDVVNENDEVLYAISKQDAHTKGLLHRTVIAEVIDSKGAWTLVKQASNRQDALQYVSPVGGHVSAGETEDDALKREAYEEMGLQSENFTYKQIGKAIFNRTVLNRYENHLFILYEITTDQTPVLNHESIDYKVFQIEELKQEIQKHPQIFGAAFHFVVNTFYKSLQQ